MVKLLFIGAGLEGTYESWVKILGSGFYYVKTYQELMGLTEVGRQGRERIVVCIADIHLAQYLQMRDKLYRHICTPGDTQHKLVFVCGREVKVAVDRQPVI
jgi:hypothetical protein